MRKKIHKHLSNGKSKEEIIRALLREGHDERVVQREVGSAITQKAITTGYLLFLASIFIFVVFFRPAITGLAIEPGSSETYTGARFSSADFSPETGIIYQGDEKIFRGKTELGIQGMSYGSVDIIDFNNDGNADLFTTGQYGTGEEEVRSTLLYEKLNSLVDAPIADVSYSDACWADFDNNGWIEPAVIGSGEENHFVIYKNNEGEIKQVQTFTGLSDGAIECFDFDNDGWVDILACGEDSEGRERTILLRNENGNLAQSSTSISSLKSCDISINNFDKNEYLDAVISGSSNSAFTLTEKYTNSGGSFSGSTLSTPQLVERRKLTSGDFNNDGIADIAVSGGDVTGSGKNIFFASPSFESSTELLQLRNSDILFLNYNKNGFIDFFQTGASAQLSMDLTSTANSPPSIPSGLDYEVEGDYLRLKWEPAADDLTPYPFYHVRAGTDSNPNQFLSGFLSSQRGNAELNTFKLLKDPKECFFFQVKAIDGAYQESDWSEKYYVNCGKESSEKNETELPAPIENETVKISEKRWSYTVNKDNIKYVADYESSDVIRVTEIIYNNDIYTNKITIRHPLNTQFNDQGGYSRTKNYFEVRLELAAGEKAFVSYILSDLQGDHLDTTILPTQIIPGEKKEVEEEVKIEDNKTIIEIPNKVNESSIAEEGVVIRQEIPKCLIEKITELAVESGRVKASAEFTILEEDPVIMWKFEKVVDPENIKLEIDAIADENCTNLIKTEIVAKKVLAGKDKADMLNLFVIVVSIFLLLLGTYLFVNNAKTYHRKTALIIFAVLFILLNIFDALSMLHESLDFLKKLLSWVLMLALLYHVNLTQTLFAGKEHKSHPSINALLLLSFTALSIKNITFIAFKTYGTELFFSDLLFPIIKYADVLEQWIFFGGAISLVLLTLFITFAFKLSSPSFASLLHKTEYEFLGRWLRKPFYVFLILIGFYMAFFNFLFGWFSIAFDGSFLVIILVVIVYHAIRSRHKEKLKGVHEKPDTLIERFMKLFTDEKYVFIAFSALPILIFVVEIYNYLVYMLLGIKSVYFEVIDIAMPTYASLNVDVSIVPLYALQLLGLLSAVMLAFLFWWHFFSKRNQSNVIRDRPKHPVLFSVFCTAAIAYLLKPVFEISLLNKGTLSGVLIVLQNVTMDNLYVVYGVLAVFLVVSYLVFRHIEQLNIVPYAILLASVISVTIMFMISFASSIKTGALGSFSVLGFNEAFLLLMYIVYLGILVFSLYALIGEFLNLVDEEFRRKRMYRKLVGVFFPHKFTLKDEERERVKQRMEELLDKGEEDYLVIEQVHKSTHIPIRELGRILNEVERVDEEKHKEHAIFHEHHKLKEIATLRKYIKQHYKRGVDAKRIIDHLLQHNWSQDDIAAAFIGVRPKSKDKALFEAMRRVNF